MKPRDRGIVGLEWELANAKKEIERQRAEIAQLKAMKWGDEVTEEEYTAHLEDDNAVLALLVRDFAQVGDRVLKVIDELMPGVRHIALQNYQELNDAPLALRRMILKSRELP